MSYDFSNKFDQLKNIMLANGAPKLNFMDARKVFDKKMPVTDLAEFKIFDESLLEEETRQSLLTLYRVCICGESKLNSCIAKIMQETLTKNVELEYSGAGKTKKGVGKLDFSSTNTYSCLKGIKLSQ